MESRQLIIASATVLTLVACTGDDASPTTTTTASTTSSTTSTTSTTSTSTTTTLPPTTTTTVPGAGAVAAICSVLQAGAWADRRAAILTFTAQFEADGGSGPLVDAVRAACPDDLARQEAAIGLEQRADGANLQESLNLGGLSCGNNVMSVTLTNKAPEEVGIVVAGTSRRGDDVGQFQSGSMLWGVAPGGSQPFSVPNAGPDGYCGFVGHVFLTDDSATDAGTPSGTGPATTGDDPTVWLPALETNARQWLAAPTAYGDADVFDLRAIVARDLPEPLTDVHPVVGVVVCPGTVEQPTPDRMAFAYGVEYGPLGDHPGYWDLRYTAFRRGSDGRWRYLAAPFVLEGNLTGANCARPIPHP